MGEPENLTLKKLIFEIIIYEDDLSIPKNKENLIIIRKYIKTKSLDKHKAKAEVKAKAKAKAISKRNAK